MGKKHNKNNDEFYQDMDEFDKPEDFNDEEDIEEAEIEPNTECKEIVVTGEIIDDENPMEDELNRCDKENSEHIAKDLMKFGDLYEEAKKSIELGKLELKSIVDSAKEKGITKGMIETYIQMKNYPDITKYTLMSAVNEKRK